MRRNIDVRNELPKGDSQTRSVTLWFAASDPRNIGVLKRNRRVEQTVGLLQ